MIKMHVVEPDELPDHVTAAVVEQPGVTHYLIRRDATADQIARTISTHTAHTEPTDAPRTRRPPTAQ